MITRVRAALCELALVASGAVQPPSAQGRGTLAIVAPQSAQALRDWDAKTQAMLRSGELRVRRVEDDALVAGRTHERADQYYRGVRVFGGDIARQLDGQDVVMSVFGTLYDGLELSPDPALDADAVRPLVNALAGTDQPDTLRPELVVLPIAGDDGSIQYRLAWRARAVTDRADIVQYFLDASSGAVLRQYSDRQTQAAVGTATGVLGDRKKISASGSTGHFLARDLLRPALIQTDDLKGDANRVNDFLIGTIPLAASDIAADGDNVWTDGSIADAHVYAGLTYDYYFKRFGRRGLDGGNLKELILGNPVRREDFATFFGRFPDFFLNAFYAGGGVVLFGVGLPAGSTFQGQTFDFFSAAIDIVAHELTHGVTEFSSNLIYLNESGALNEAFSDIMGTSVEFFFQPAGTGPMKADYLLAEDVVTAAASSALSGLRSMADPNLYGQPDHYSKRYLGTSDNGGVHINSGIPNHAFYLAIEGGVNRTSGIRVQGVGASNRGQIEKIFYRAFAQLMPPNANFSLARAITLQAAIDLYGATSPPYNAVRDAWTAVGVN